MCFYLIIFLNIIILQFKKKGGEDMLTPFGFKGKLRDREIEMATEEEFFELLHEEESDIN